MFSANVRGPIAENPRRATHVQNTRNSRLSCPHWNIRGDKIMTLKPLCGASIKVTNKSMLVSIESTKLH